MAYICKFNSKTLGIPLSILLTFNSLTCEALDSNLSLQVASLYWLTADVQMKKKKKFFCDKPSVSELSILTTLSTIIQILLTNYLVI